MTSRPCFVAAPTLFKGRAPHHHLFDGFGVIEVALVFPDVYLGVQPQPHGATFTYRAWLLHLLYIHPVGWRKIQPPYCFHGATATRWPRSASLGLIIGQRVELPRPATLHLHTGIWLCDPHTRALLLPSIPSLLAPGCREAISVFIYPPFLLNGLPHKFSWKG